MSSIPFSRQVESLDSGWLSSFNCYSHDSDMGNRSIPVFSMCNSGFDLSVKPPQSDSSVDLQRLDLNVGSPQLDLKVEVPDVFDNGESTDVIPIYIEDLVSGFGVDSANHEAGTSGLNVAGIDSDSELIDIEICDDNFEIYSLFTNLEEEQRRLSRNANLRAMENLEELLSLASPAREGSITDLILSPNNNMDSFMFDADYVSLDELVMSNGRSPAARTAVEDLPLVDVRKEDMIVCAICKDEAEEGEMVNRLPCSHYYHRGCIVTWLRIRSTCPICRYKLPTQ